MRRKTAKPKRRQMQISNGVAREFLFAEGFDFIWFKSHTFTKFGGSDYFYMALDKKATACTDPYNLFDGCCYDANGVFWWFQIKTNNWPDEDPIKAFMVGKPDICIIAINVKKPTKNRKTYDVKTRVYQN